MTGRIATRFTVALTAALLTMSTTSIVGSTVAGATGPGGQRIRVRAPGAVVINPIPTAVGAGEAVRVVASPGRARLTWVSSTPLTCNGGGVFAVFYAKGRCRLSLYAGGKLATRISTVVKRDPVGDADAASGVISLTFDANASKISKVSKALLAEYGDALSNALQIVVMGHATNDGGPVNSPWATHVSMRRAQKVADYLVAGGVVRSKISNYWYANRLPVSTVSERDNRRAVVVWVED